MLESTMARARQGLVLAAAACTLMQVASGAQTDPTVPVKPAWPPKGAKQRFDVTRDVWISSYSGEQKGSNGGSSKLKLKSQQEQFLFDADLSSLKGKIVTGALLHVRNASPNAIFHRVGVSSVASRWVEGTSSGYKPQEGSSCFDEAEYKKREWAYPGSTVMDVVMGRGHTIWRFADCTAPDEGGWQAVAVDPQVVRARVAGISHGFCAYDEIGHEWSIQGGEFKHHIFPNRFCYSREQRNGAPYLEIWSEGSDTTAPRAVEAVKVDVDEFPAGRALVRWKTPTDTGGSGTMGFNVTYDAGGGEKEMPRYLVPMAGAPGEEVRMQIRDIPFEPGARLKLAIRAVDGAGNAGEAFTRTIRVSTNPAAFDIKASALKPFGPSEKLPEAGGVKVAVVDLLDKIHPVSGKMIPPQPAGYRGGNHVYSAAKKLVRLQSGRNETVCFQLNLEGRASDVSVKYAFDGAPGLKAGAMIFHHVKSKAGMLPDPLMPLAGAFSIPSADGLVPGQRNQSLVCEVFVPHDEKPGKKRGAVTVSAGGGSVKLAVELEVWNFTLPNKLSFIPEMNCYGTVSPYSGYGYYRLAHEHRVCVNRLPYGWSGGVAYAPRWNGNDFDWSEWDRRVGPVLDGSAFRDLPRKGEPVDVFYLPFNENWPVNVFDHFKPSYWVDEAFTPGYKRELRKAFASFARHCNEKGWHDTILEYYMNNKVYNRKTSRSNSAPWIFDEPVNTQDFWALRWYGLLWHQAVAPVRGRARMWYRGDVSYSQYGRNIFWGVMDLECLGGSSPQKIRMKLDEQALFGHSTWTEYGSANDIESPNVQPAAWCLSAWGKGCVGVLPWQTIGNQGSWQNADKLAVFYPHASGPKPSVRLKAFTRGQQDVEYMVLLGHAYGKPRYAVANGMRKVVDTSARVLKTHEMDAGTISFRSASPQKLWELRVRAGAMISARGPAYKRSLVEFRTPESDLGRLPDIGYCRVAPEVPAHKPKCDGFRPR